MFIQRLQKTGMNLISRKGQQKMNIPCKKCVSLVRPFCKTKQHIVCTELWEYHRSLMLKFKMPLTWTPENHDAIRKSVLKELLEMYPKLKTISKGRD
jgi:cytidine deaminase